MPDNPSYSRAQLKAKSDDELEALLNLDDNEYNFRGNSQILAEIARRHREQLSRPHWTLVPMFWIAVIAGISGSIAAWPVVADWFTKLAK